MLAAIGSGSFVTRGRMRGYSVLLLVAYVVANAGVSVDEASLRNHLRDLLPAYMVPQHFVVLDALPLSTARALTRDVPAAGVQVMV